MRAFNAWGATHVNARGVSFRQQSLRMARKPTNPPSEFWIRLVECWGERKLPTSQMGIAKELPSSESDSGTMSQGSVGKWYNGTALPDRDKLIMLARAGHVTVDWLLLGRQPKRPAPPGSMLDRLLTAWEQLSPESHDILLTMAEALAEKRDEGFEQPRPQLRKRRTG